MYYQPPPPPPPSLSSLQHSLRFRYPLDRPPRKGIPSGADSVHPLPSALLVLLYVTSIHNRRRREKEDLMASDAVFNADKIGHFHKKGILYNDTMP